MLPLEPTASNDPVWSGARCRTNPIPGSSRGIPGYPEKLRIYLTGASSFWQVRCFFRGKMHTRSLRTTDPRRAVRSAQAFYEELTARYSGITGPAEPFSSVASGPLFRDAAQALLTSERARVRRGEFAAGSMDVLEAQLAKHVIPYFGALPLAEIRLSHIEKFLQKLSARSLATMTIHHYMIALRKVLKHAVAHGMLDAAPAMPAIRISSAPRGGFNMAEYRQLVRTARALVQPTSIKTRRRNTVRRARMPSDQVHADRQCNFFSVNW